MKKLLALWMTVRCGWILCWRGLVITIFLKFKPQKQEFVNRYTQRGAIKILKIAKVNFKITYAKNFKRNKADTYIFMCNHQSLIDLALIFAVLTGTVRVIAKEELFWIPLFGQALTASGCIPIHRDNPANTANSFLEAKKNLNSGLSLLIFPEGTRSKSGELLPFKPGGFRLARETGNKIIPIAIIGTNAILPAGKWLMNAKQKAEIKIGTPIDVAPYTTIETQKELMNKVRNVIASLIM